MDKTTLTMIIYVLGLIFGAFFLDFWNPKTNPRALIGIIWTSLFLITLFYVEKKN